MNLNRSQEKAVAHENGPCLVVAGPGSGKTYTIATRIKYLIQTCKVRPEEILVITFTKDAAKEMKNRYCHMNQDNLHSNEITFGTFHGVYYSILKRNYSFNEKSILTEKEKFILIKGIIEQKGQFKGYSLEDFDELVFGLLQDIGKIKNGLVTLADMEEKKRGRIPVVEVYKDYQRLKKKENKIDFEDMILLCYKLFQNNSEELLFWQKKFKYILVDEFQDVNKAQYEVLKLLALPENNLFVVGDDDQAIYGFRGAKPGIMEDFLQDYPKAERYDLNVNYRSTKHIIRNSMKVISNNKKRLAKDIMGRKDSKETVHVQEVKDVHEESEYLIEMIRRYLEEGVQPEEIAVLYRTHMEVRVLKEKLEGQMIPFQMSDHIPNIYNHFTVKDIVAYLRLAAGERSRKLFIQIGNKPLRYLSRHSFTKEEVSFRDLKNYYVNQDWMHKRVEEMERDIRNLSGKSPYLAISYIREKMGYDKYLIEYSKERNLEPGEFLVRLDEIQELSKSYTTVYEWLDHIDESYKQKQKKETKGIILSSIHASKGLEYSVVFILRSNEGSIPHRKAETRAEIEEERRLFYVAMTRAKEKLIITYIKEQRGKDLNPSLFVKELLKPL
ncbi:DNA helicase-2/ATP-dependent DNA helicase PcrA [Aequitasia blattaphilus]|uniref:DNA 3'-5' helicase n=1 Tax=Aequitasia blattaphilus TaxID=2949332 RepID=A0ABT1E6W3_9FIRM|nr:ATP-dependent helicase [Aequitasia blattaphilus]MCP1101508.1 ATP-dependent helicase [Aequitasia blattaphilus]MCR8614148.1 ATP-dependent helicase [Aequitasia blattaphilus]